MVTLVSRVHLGSKVLFRDLDGEAVLLEEQSGKYYGLNEVGTRIWLLLRQHGELGLAYQVLLSEYEVAEGRLRDELLDFVASLAARGLLEIEPSNEASD